MTLESKKRAEERRAWGEERERLEREKKEAEEIANSFKAQLVCTHTTPGSAPYLYFSFLTGQTRFALLAQVQHVHRLIILPDHNLMICCCQVRASAESLPADPRAAVGAFVPRPPAHRDGAVYPGGRNAAMVMQEEGYNDRFDDRARTLNPGENHLSRQRPCQGLVES